MEPKWVQSAIKELDQSVDSMDAVDSGRLQTARQIAQREAASRSALTSGLGLGFSEWLNWKSGLTFACLAVVVAAVVFTTNQPLSQEPLIAKSEQTTQQAKPKVGIQMMPLLTAKEDMEFYESVNFLIWLENKQGKS